MFVIVNAHCSQKERAFTFTIVIFFEISMELYILYLTNIVLCAILL